MIDDANEISLPAWFAMRPSLLRPAMKGAEWAAQRGVPIASKPVSEGSSGANDFSIGFATQGSFGFSANLVSFSTG